MKLSVHWEQLTVTDLIDPNAIPIADARMAARPADPRRAPGSRCAPLLVKTTNVSRNSCASRLFTPFVRRPCVRIWVSAGAAGRRLS
jgi:hypothetical protein